MSLLGPRLFVAFDASGLSGAVVSRGLGGVKIQAFARVPLGAGALVPSHWEPNLSRPAEVREALGALGSRLQANGRRAVLVLPDGVGRLAILEPGRGMAPLDFARFRLTHGLPYAASEAAIEVLPLRGGRFLAAAVRRSVVGDYETVAAEAGFAQERVDLAPVSAFAALSRGPNGASARVDVILSDTAYCLAAFQGGVLQAFRNRRRDPGTDEGERVLDEVDRTAGLAAGDGVPPRLRVVGPGARALVREFSDSGRGAETGWDTEGDELAGEAAELSWLGAAIA